MKSVIYEKNRYILSFDDLVLPCEIYAVPANGSEKKLLEKNWNAVKYSVELPREHWVFHIKDNTECLTTRACRRVELAELGNFRDLGGYQVGTKHVKWGKLYRSGVPYNLSKDAVGFIEKLGIGTLFDFRSASEVAKEPDVTLSNCEHKNYSGLTNLGDMANLDLDLIIEHIQVNKEMQKKFREFLIGSYREMAVNPVPFQRYFQDLLQNVKNPKPILFHCTAGKDRTGVCGALTLLALGVDFQYIYEDYMLSAEYISQKHITLLDTIKKYNLNEEIFTLFADLLTVKKEYLDAFFATMHEKWGNSENFFAQALGLKKEDREKLCEVYLEQRALPLHRKGQAFRTSTYRTAK